jgi:hypothetical protein
VQLEHGAYPVADHVLPLTHAGTATHSRTVAFHAKAGELQAQLDWPVSALLVLYSCDVGHVRQAASPRTENLPAPQGVHTVSVVVVHAPPLAMAEPAAHVVHDVHVFAFAVVE